MAQNMLKWGALAVFIACSAASLAKARTIYMELLSEVEELSNQARQHAELVSEIEKRTTTQLTALSNKNASQDTKISELDNRIVNLTRKSVCVDSQLTSQGTQLNIHDTMVKDLEERFEHLNGGDGGQKAAFTAYSTRDQPASDQSPIIFDKAVINDGKCYDPTTGIFTAQSDGIYAIFCALKTTILYPDVVLVIGDSSIVVYSSDDTVVGGAVKFLKRNEKAYLRPTGNTGSLHGSPGSPTSSFWGFSL